MDGNSRFSSKIAQHFTTSIKSLVESFEHPHEEVLEMNDNGAPMRSKR